MRTSKGPTLGASGLAAALLLACGPEVTFSEHIAPILQAKCQSCHRPGQIAPMSLLTYQEARPFAPAILASISMGNMPPFYAAGPPGYYKDDIRLSEEEKELISEWVSSGAPEGDPALAPEPIDWDDSGWPLGEPDLVIEFPRYFPPLVGKDHYITLVTDHVFAEDIWARALHLETESKNVAHHSTQFLWDPEIEVPPEGKTLDHVTGPLASPLFTWFPGFQLEPLRAGQAILLPRSWRVASRTHFAPTRKQVSEKMALGIYFADGIVDTVQKKLGSFVTDLAIPPGASGYTRTESATFSEDALVSHFMVHLHLRGKAARIIFHYPDGSEPCGVRSPARSIRLAALLLPGRAPGSSRRNRGGIRRRLGQQLRQSVQSGSHGLVSLGRRTVDEMFSMNAFYTPRTKLESPVVVRNRRSVGEPSRETRKDASVPLL